MKKDNLTRIDINFKKILEQASIERIRNKIDKKKRGFRELTSMTLNCPSFPNLLNELENIPKKEDIK